MGKVFGWITGIKLPDVGTMIVYGVIVTVLGSVGFLGYNYAQRGNRIEKLELEVKGWEAEKKIWIKEQMSLMDANDSLVVVVGNARTEKKEDSLNFVSRERDYQKVLSELKTDRNYWKDYADKLESGDYEVQKAIWPFKGKKLVKKKVGV